MILVNNNCKKKNNKKNNASYYSAVTAVTAGDSFGPPGDGSFGPPGDGSFGPPGDGLFGPPGGGSFDDGSFGPPDDGDSFDPSNDGSSFGIFIPFNNDETTGSKINLESYDEEFGEEEWGDDEDSGWDDDDDTEKIQNLKNKDLKLVWKKDSELEKIKRGRYVTGKTPRSSYYEKYGPTGLFTKAAVNTKKITNFFKISDQVANIQLNEIEQISSDSEDEVNNRNTYQIDEKIRNLKEQLEKQYNQMTVTEYNNKRAVFEYLTRLNNGKIHASLEAAKIVFVDGGSWKARRIRYYANYWLLNNKFPVSKRGKHQKTIRLIDDEDIAEKCRTWIHEQNFKVTPTTFKEFVEKELLPNIGVTKRKSISLMTAMRWLNILGYSFQKHHQGIYYDGHERDDVLQYREVFLEKIFEHEKYMSKYEGETMKRIYPNLPEGEKERILVTHDECIFYFNDGKRGVWAKNGELPLRKKGNGRSIMVSEFLTEIDGRLCLQQTNILQNPNIPEEARCYLKPGKNQEGYWTAEHLLEQIKCKVIPIFETLYPNCVAVFAFDNSSNHAAFGKDALVAS